MKIVENTEARLLTFNLVSKNGAHYAIKFMPGERKELTDDEFKALTAKDQWFFAEKVRAGNLVIHGKGDESLGLPAGASKSKPPSSDTSKLTPAQKRAATLAKKKAAKKKDDDEKKKEAEAIAKAKEEDAAQVADDPAEKDQSEVKDPDWLADQDDSK